MTKRSRTPILLLCAALGVACHSERVFEPELKPTKARPDTLSVPGHEEWRTLGNYQLTALVKSGGWGDMTDARYTASLTLELEQASGELRGALTDMRFVTATEEVEMGTKGVSGSFANGEVRIYTTTAWPFAMQGVILESGDIAGTFDCCAIGDISGTFTATQISQ